MAKTKEKTAMEISDELYKRIKAFKEVVEAVTDEKYDMNEFTDGLLDNGINLLLEKLLANIGQETLLQSLQQLGTKYPAEVYGFIAETLRRGDEINKGELKKTLGFEVEK